MKLETLKSLNLRNRNSFSVIKSKFLSVSSMITWSLCSPFWKSLTQDVTWYWQADCTTDFLGDTSPPPAPWQIDHLPNWDGKYVSWRISWSSGKEPKTVDREIKRKNKHTIITQPPVTTLRPRFAKNDIINTESIISITHSEQLTY